MTVTSTSQKPLPDRYNLRPTPQRLSRWLNWLCTGLFTCWVIGQALGHLYFFELFSHFPVQYVWLAYGFMALGIVYRLVYPRQAQLRLYNVAFLLLIMIGSYNI